MQNVKATNITLMNNLILAFILFFIGQCLIWFQSNGQFVWPWFKENPWTISIIFGTLASYIFIKATAAVVTHFGGVLWPGRFIGFSSGIVVFALCTYIFLGEGINLKTIVSLLLAVALVCVQIFWK
jgi:hypothetical protein